MGGALPFAAGVADRAGSHEASNIGTKLREALFDAARYGSVWGFDHAETETRTRQGERAERLGPEPGAADKQGTLVRGWRSPVEAG